MNRFVLIAAILFICACNNQDGPQEAPADTSIAATKQDSSSGFVYNFTDSALHDKITDTLMQLPFVKESNRYIDSISNHKKAIAFITDTTGTAISVMAGYNGVERFETYYHFTIDPKNFEIKIMDIASGDFIPVADYLKKNKEPE